MNSSQRRKIRRITSRMFPIGCTVSVKTPGSNSVTRGIISGIPGASVLGSGGMSTRPEKAYVFVKYANGRKYWRSVAWMQRI